MALMDLLRSPEIPKNMDSGTERVLVHRSILLNRPMIRGVFEEFYRRIRTLDAELFGATQGLRVELGSGSSTLKDNYPDIVTSDIVPAPHLDRVLDAMDLALEDQSVRTLYCINCFHHFPDPARFFQEVRRVVRPGGGVILIDPFFGPLAASVYANLFREETFDRRAPGWRANEQRDPERANQALSYVIFFRDRERFLRENPDLEIAHTEIMSNYLRYLCSGGLNFRQLLPSAAVGTLKFAERVLVPAMPALALHHLVALRRR